MSDDLYIQFVHEARNALVPAKFHLDSLRQTLTDPRHLDRLDKIWQGVQRALNMATEIANGDTAKQVARNIFKVLLIQGDGQWAVHSVDYHIWAKGPDIETTIESFETKLISEIRSDRSVNQRLFFGCGPSDPVIRALTRQALRITGGLSVAPTVPTELNWFCEYEFYLHVYKPCLPHKT